jgi:hypothetical protein
MKSARCVALKETYGFLIILPFVSAFCSSLDTENAEEIKKFIANNYCTDDEFSGYFSDRLDESEYSG